MRKLCVVSIIGGKTKYLSGEKEDLGVEIIRLETQRRQYGGHNTPPGYYTDQGP